MSGMQQAERRAPTASAPSQTTTVTEPSLGSPDVDTTRTQPARTLRLRGARASAARSVQWAEDVVDNEGLGRKSSKGTPGNHRSFCHVSFTPSLLTLHFAILVCCIYHRPKAVDESSDDSSSSSDSDSSGADSDLDADRKGKARACGHSHGGRGRRTGRKDNNDKDGQARRPSPNAYEKVPKPKPKEAAHDAGASKTSMN